MRAGRTTTPEAVGVAVLALQNLAVHRLLPAPAGAALNLATAAGLTTFARHAGCSQADLGIGVEDAGRGLRVGLAAAAVAGGGVALGAALPATRRFFGDRRVSDVGRGELAYQLTVRIPLGTALAEEVLFRGALLACSGNGAHRPPPCCGPRCCSEPGTYSRRSTTTREIPRATWWPTRAGDGGWPCWRRRCPRPGPVACSRGCGAVAQRARAGPGPRGGQCLGLSGRTTGW